uniref:Uncharacterized protein n=1 Tax=Clytia hemisphaerica TaxID=252671 RepID=A0A7M5V6R4_9CNID
MADNGNQIHEVADHGHWDHWSSVANSENRKKNAGHIKQTKFKSILESNNLDKKALKILSIGPGDGILDEILVKESQLDVTLYYAVDPVETEYHSKLEENVKTWKVPYAIEKKSFNENYSPPQNILVTYPDGSTESLKENDQNGRNEEVIPGERFVSSSDMIQGAIGMFDVILMASVLYYVDYPGLTIQNARSMLSQGGRIIIFNQTEEVGAELYALMAQTSSIEFREQTSNYALSHLGIIRELDDLNIPYKCEINKDEVLCYDVTDYLKNGTPLPYFSFQTQKPFEKWTDEQRRGIYEIVEKRSFVSEKGRNLLPEDIATIVVGSMN